MTQDAIQSAGSSWRSIIIKLLLLVLISALIGTAINLLRPHSIAWLYTDPDVRREQFVRERQIRTTLQSEDRGASPGLTGSTIRRLEIADFLNLYESGSLLLIDARPSAFYEEGHIPGALNLSRSDFERDYRSLEDRMKTVSGCAVIIYCADSDCEDSGVVAEALIRMGVESVSLFVGGWAAWDELGLQEIYGEISSSSPEGGD